MREHVPDVNLAAIEMDRSNQPNLIAADIEYAPLIYLIHGWESSAEFGKILEVGGCHHLEPTHQRRFAIRMLLPEKAQCFAGDDMHEYIISQNEMLADFSR